MLTVHRGKKLLHHTSDASGACRQRQKKNVVALLPGKNSENNENTKDTKNTKNNQMKSARDSILLLTLPHATTTVHEYHLTN